MEEDDADKGVDEIVAMLYENYQIFIAELEKNPQFKPDGVDFFTAHLHGFVYNLPESERTGRI